MKNDMNSPDVPSESFQEVELRLFSDLPGSGRNAARISIAAPGSGDWRDGDCVWSWTAHEEPVSQPPGMVELCLRLELLEGHSEATRIAVDPGLPKWTAQHYLVIPGAVYDANRLPCRTFRYPPFLADEDILGVQTQSVVGDILWGSGATGTMPRLAIGTASSALSLRSNDCAMPAVGVYDPVQQFGHWWFIEHRTRLGNSGIAVEESDDRSRAHLRFSFPGKRCYGMPAEAEQMPDWKAGDKLEIRIRRATFACTSRPGLLMGWLPLRHGLESAPVWFNEFPLSAAARLIEEKFNRDNWDEERGLYRFSINPDAPSIWSAGWGGGLIREFPLWRNGTVLTQERALKTVGWACCHLISPLGFFYGKFGGGKPIGDHFHRTSEARWLLIRRNGDALFAGLKLMAAMRGLKHPIPALWEDSFRQCAGALANLWERHGQLGQFIDADSGEILIGGTTSCALAPAALCAAAEVFDDRRFLETAAAVAGQYAARDLARGYTNGGPGEALQCPDSESAFALLESLTVLWEATGESRWLGWAEEVAALCATWMTWYDYPFPAKSVFGRMEMHSYGAVWANAQNKHGAPNICTLSGVGLLKLFRGTGRRDYLDMLRAVTHHQTQYVARDDRPIDPGLRSGWMQEKVNLSDWGPGSGGIDHSSTWPETALLSSYAEVPGIYLQFDTGVIAALDHVKVEWDGHGGIIIENPTRYDAVYRVLADDAASLRRPLGWSPSSRYVDIPVAAKERRAVTLQAWLA